MERKRKRVFRHNIQLFNLQGQIETEYKLPNRLGSCLKLQIHVRIHNTIDHYPGKVSLQSNCLHIVYSIEYNDGERKETVTFSSNQCWLLGCIMLNSQ